MCCKGFTLIELLIVLAIIAITLTIAVPAFRETMISNRTSVSVNQFVATLAFARSEAVKRARTVTIKRKNATSRTWESGWYLFVDINGNGALNDDGDNNLCEPGEDCLLKSYDALPLGYTLRSVGTYANDWIAFSGNGFSKGSGAWSNDETFRLCDRTANTTTSRAIKINQAGRALVAKGTVTCP